MAGAESAGAQFTLEPGLSLSLGGNKLIDTRSAPTVNHSEGYFAVGVGGEFRAGYRWDFLSLSATGFAHWEGARYRATANGSSIFSSTEYAVTNLRYGLGPGLAFHLPWAGIRFLTEYFPLATNEITYAGNAAINPWRKGDKLTGTGWGVGLSYQLVAQINLYVIYRSFSFFQGKIGGVSVSLPDGNFSRLSSSAAFTGATYSF